MSEVEQELQALKDIRNMMERSSRFISLSGWSGIGAGLAALAGAWMADLRIKAYFANWTVDESCPECLLKELWIIAAAVFVVALAAAFFFTYAKARKEGVQVWGPSSRRLLWHTLMPMAVGGIVILRMMYLQYYEMVAPVSLVFYGLALVNGSKFTLGEVRYLGYAVILTGILGLWLPKQGLVIWAFGFGILHIIYGVAMWWKHERRKDA